MNFPGTPDKSSILPFHESSDHPDESTEWHLYDFIIPSNLDIIFGALREGESGRLQIGIPPNEEPLIRTLIVMHQLEEYLQDRGLRRFDLRIVSNATATISYGPIKPIEHQRGVE